MVPCPCHDAESERSDALERRALHIRRRRRGPRPRRGGGFRRFHVILNPRHPRRQMRLHVFQYLRLDVIHGVRRGAERQGPSSLGLTQRMIFVSAAVATDATDAIHHPRQRREG